jgi:hypothetical protein
VRLVSGADSVKRRRFITKRRRTIIIVLMLLVWGAGGAIVNVAVAWGCAFSTDTRNAESDFDTPAFSNWLQEWEKRRSVHVGSLFIQRNSVMVVFTMYGNMAGTAEVKHVVVQRCTSGWPVHSLAGERLALLADDFSRSGREVHSGAITLRDPKSAIAQNTAELLPCIPIWPGFAINTVFYAATLWLLFAAPFALQKRRHIKRGWCLKCAYDLRGRAPTSAVCPECGAAVARWGEISRRVPNPPTHNSSGPQATTAVSIASQHMACQGLSDNQSKVGALSGTIPN